MKPKHESAQALALSIAPHGVGKIQFFLSTPNESFVSLTVCIPIKNMSPRDNEKKFD